MSKAKSFVEEVELQGHIIDSLLLPKQLEDILSAIHDHGAVSTTLRDCEYELADMNGAFPERFYSTTNYRTQVRLDNEWIDVDSQEMDCGIVLDLQKRTACCLAMVHVN